MSYKFLLRLFRTFEKDQITLVISICILVKICLIFIIIVSASKTASDRLLDWRFISSLITNNRLSTGIKNSFTITLTLIEKKI